MAEGGLLAPSQSLLAKLPLTYRADIPMTFFNSFKQLRLVTSAGLLISALAFTANTHAQWQLVNDVSQLNFISTKATHVGEAHTFTQLQGSVNESGLARLSIDLSSVETMIPIRNERMQAMLFTTTAFPTADFSAQVDLENLSQMKVGDVADATLNGQLSFGPATLPLSADVRIIRLHSSSVQIQTLRPVMLNATTLGAAVGVEKLRTAAGLPSISHSVPVTFSLIFKK